ncbi:MAG TPA: hypothetical protein VNW97_05495 [Candidatus Saccharimonadales bacterium]|jgi:hypothetical protein|nr:hypothetical protein [Candidatus Saccharimonadales bacterium]
MKIRNLGFIAFLLLAALFPAGAFAIPAFSRMYQTSCTTCHLDFPKLNDFGKAFKDAGFRFPSDDETFIKVPPVMLGADAQKEQFPHTVWPGVIPGLPPIGLRMNTFFQTTGGNRGQFNSLSAPGTVNPFVPRTDFSSGFFSIFTAGNFGSDIAFWVDNDFSVGGANSSGGLGDGYLRFVNVGRLVRLPKDSLHLRVGRFELDLPFTQARSYNISPYDIYTQANIGATNPAFAAQQNVNNHFTPAGAANGVEFSGGHIYGGYHYSLSVVDQNTSGTTQAANSSPFLPSPTGGNNGGVGFASNSNFKDLYGRFSYRFNLERDETSRKSVQAAGATGPRDHTYLNLGTYYFYGRSAQRFSGQDLTGSPAVLTAHEPFYRVGGDFSFNYRTINLFGLFMYGHDHNLLPIDSTGTPVPLPIGGVTSTTVGFVRGGPATFAGGFIQADYQPLPWMVAIMRWDAVNSGPDKLNGLIQSTTPPFLQPFNNTRNRFTPGVQFLIHANIKTSFEYQIRPQQYVTVVTNPLTGLPTAVQPFRTNTAVVALEFVY